MRKLLLLPLVLIVPLVIAGHSLTSGALAPSPAPQNLIASNSPAALASNAGTQQDKSAVTLAPTPEEARAARLTYGLLSDSQFHYRPLPLDAAMSAQIFKRYLDDLDADKMFFTAADIKRFEPYRTTLDVAIKSERLQPAFDIFAVYLKRIDERVAFARELLKHDFDFSGKDTWAYDRKDVPWAADTAALDDLWHKSVKNDVLRLKLAGQKPEEIRKTLDKRYAQLASRAHSLTGEDVFQTFLDSYAMSLDPHTNYMDPRTTENFNISMRLSLQGIGAVLQKQDDYVAIRSMVPGGPAASSGKIKVGDRITAVGQGATGPMEDVVGWRIDDVVDKIRGDKDTKVRLDVLPGDAGVDAKPITITIVRKEVRLEEQAAKSKIIQTGIGAAKHTIGIIELPTFYEDFEGRRKNDPDYASATRDVAKILAQFKTQKVDGVVVDLRDNGGGSLTEAIDLTGLFVGPGPVVQVREAGGHVDVQDDDGSHATWTGPLAVLVNRGSASASEIFAAAIQDYGRGLIVGENTFGKGTVQNLIDLDRVPHPENQHYGQVKLTVAEFFRVNGGSTQHKGVVPDIAFPASLDGKDYGESTYDNALPYSEIKSADYHSLSRFANLVPRLVALFDERAKTDQEFQWWLQDYAEYREQADKKVLSLNLADRTAERDRDEAKRKLRDAERKKAGLEVPDDERADDGLQADERNIAEEAKLEKEAKDRISPLQRETAAILGDAIDLLNSDTKLAQAVLPEHAHGAWAN
jgi:carboxyl-terminal processing protease